MKIVLWPTHYVPNVGGLEIMTHALAKELTNKGHTVLVITCNVNSREFKEYEIDGVHVHALPLTEALLRRNLPLIKKNLQILSEILGKFQPDIVNVHGWFETFCFYQARALKELPFCLTVHGLLEQSHYTTPDCMRLWAQSKAVNTVSHALIPSLTEYGFTHNRLQVIYNGMQPDPRPLKRQAENQLLMIGRLTQEKCFDMGFHALKILQEKYPDLRLTLIGGGPLYEELAQLRAHLGLEEKIKMTDFVRPDKVVDYIDASTLVLVPSYYESFCLVALEAASRGRAVIASNVYGLKEVIVHEETGLLIPPQDPASVAKAIDALLSDPEKLERMGKAGRKRAEIFSIEETAKNYLNLYESVCPLSV